MGGVPERNDDDVPPTTAFNILANARRRVVLDHLRQTGPTDVDDLAAEILRNEDRSVQFETVRVSLTHLHLPKMDDAGFVRRDGEETVAPTDRLGTLDPYFELLE
jgi:hypothetical protein